MSRVSVIVYGRQRFLSYLKDMSSQRSLLPMMAFLMASTAIAQVAPVTSLAAPAPWFALQSLPQAAPAEPQPDAARLLGDFKDTDIKFNLRTMMDILRDHQHEGWVLAAYPDPITRHPLVGAGFSLDVPARTHPQTDPLNAHPFVEPSSAELWQAAGLAPERLQQILDQYDHNLDRWSEKKYRHKVVRQTLTPDLTEAEGEQLLRISAIQAIYNAKAYCRSFDQLSASQQMALSQLVFQMGVNLEQFVSFLGALNDPDGARELPRLDGYLETQPEHWRTVQAALMDSQWARRYSVRAATVIAMFDPEYNRQPQAAEQRIAAVLSPPVEVHRRTRSAATLRLASYSKHSARAHGKKPKRRLT
jgi:hypothetical protein